MLSIMEDIAKTIYGLQSALREHHLEFLSNKKCHIKALIAHPKTVKVASRPF